MSDLDAASVSIHFRCEGDAFNDGAGGAFEISRIVAGAARIIREKGLPNGPIILRDQQGNTVGQAVVQTVRRKA